MRDRLERAKRHADTASRIVEEHRETVRCYLDQPSEDRHPESFEALQAAGVRSAAIAQANAMAALALWVTDVGPVGS